MLQQDLNLFEGGLDERAKAYLLETTRWTKFLAIIGFIATCFWLFVAYIYFRMDSFIPYQYSSQYNSLMVYYRGVIIGMGIFNLIIAAIHLYCSILLMQFSGKIKTGIEANDTNLIADGLRHQKNLYKLFGILAITSIILILASFIIIGMLV